MLAQLFYHTVRIYVRIVLKFFFRKWQTHGTENIPKNAAVIYVVNHQNAFLDAILIACATTHEPWFLTRAGVFSNRFVRALLKLFHMMPVYRFRDGWKSLRNNDTTIRQCVDLLNNRQSVLLFVEGDQGMQWKLRALQKGFARIAWIAQQENDWKLPLYILPVGIQYDHHYNFRSRVLLNYGKPFAIDNLYQPMAEREFLEALIEKAEASLKPLMLHIEDADYQAIENYLRLHRNKSDLREQLHHDQQVVAHWNTNPPPQNGKTPKHYFLLLLTLPLHIYCWVNNFIPWLLLRWIVKKYVTVEFKGSLKVALGMVIVPFFYLVQSMVIHTVFNDWRITLAYALTLPFVSVWSIDLFKWSTGSNQ
jgi:1-acyl-sn-glycerol-3-phosphate acyltransferase